VNGMVVWMRSIFDMRRLLVAILVTVVVLSLTHIPQAKMPQVLMAGGLDKFEHVGAYGLVALCYLLAVKRSAGLWVPLAIILVLAGLAAMDEVTQPLVHRSCDFMDWVSDAIGITLAWIASAAARRWKAGANRSN
jgi:hypothetical protein